MERSYTARDLMQAANLSVGMYQQWKARKFIETEVQTSGRGNKQHYSFKEIFAVAVLSELVRLGIAISAAARMGSLYGFKNEEAYLVLRRFPIPFVDFGAQGETYEYELADCQVVSEIFPASKVADVLSKYPACVLVNLNAVEDRVKKSLGIE